MISSWSGGKDSCLACHKAIHGGSEIKVLLNFISREHKRCCFHGIEADLMKLQAESIGIPIVQKEVTADLTEYEKEFKEAVGELKSKGMKKMVFGDIYLLEQYSWVDRVCGEIGIEPVEPLWNQPTDKILEEFIDLGYKAMVVSAKADLFDGSFIGRIIDKKMLSELKERKICPCGENGEFHTFVMDGPIFKKKIEITESRPILKEGFWKHWFLDIKKYQISPKS